MEIKKFLKGVLVVGLLAFLLNSFQLVKVEAEKKNNPSALKMKLW